MKKHEGDEFFKKNSVVLGPMDDMIFKKVKREADIINDLIKRHKKDYPIIPKLTEDVFESLYKIDPELEKMRNMDRKYEMNHTLMECAMELQDYQMLRGYTHLDEFSSAICGEVITEELMLMHREAKEEAEKAAKDLEEQMKKDPSMGKSKIAGASDKLKNKLMKQLIKERMPEKMKNAIRDSVEKMKDFSSIDSAWGTDPGHDQKLPFKEKMEIAKKLKESEKMAQITKMAGKMRNIAITSRRSRISPGTSEIFEVEEGDDIGRVLPSELAYYKIPKARKIFMKKLAMKELLQYKLIDRAMDEKGPIVICIDNSGSMSGDPEIWSKALAVGMIELAMKDKRTLIVNHYGSSCDPIKKYIFNPNENNTLQLIDMSEFFLGGGTDFVKPLNEARKDISDRLEDADIVFITDGICGVPDQWVEDFNKWRHEKKVKVYSFLVDFVNESPDVLKEFSDMVMPSSHLDNSNRTELELYKNI